MSRKAMQMALEALESDPLSHAGLVSRKQAITALRLALEKQWVGLTDEEVSEIIDREIGFNSCWGPEETLARAIEAKLREKNHG